MSTILFSTSSAFYTPTLIVLLALVIDALVGDPKWFYRFVPHPVVIIGKFVSFQEWINVPSATILAGIVNGAIVTVQTVVVTAGAGYLIAIYCQSHPLAMIVLAVFASSMIAWRGLWDHVRDVAVGLDRSLEEGRTAVSHIVGRDPETLDEPAISRAAIESLSENFSDGTVAPVFWFAFLGLPGLCGYKAINTLDSMIGHRTKEYEFFGKVAARVDDIVNYIPARLTALLIAAAAAFLAEASSARSLRVMIRDASLHRSVNAGWPEAAMAGALDIALAGPRIYNGEEVEDFWMNETGRRDIGPVHIYRALHLYRIAGGLLMLILLLVAAAIYAVI